MSARPSGIGTLKRRKGVRKWRRYSDENWSKGNKFRRVLLHSYTILNFYMNINFGTTGFGEICILTWGGS
jgi:hypothetical protein